MRIAIDIDKDLLVRAAELSGEEKHSKIVRLAIQAFIARESSRRLAALGGSQPNLKPVSRRRL